MSLRSDRVKASGSSSPTRPRARRGATLGASPKRTPSRVREVEELRARVKELEAERALPCIADGTLGDESSALVLHIDGHGSILHFNPAFERLAGRTLDEVRGHDWFEIFVPTAERPRARRRLLGDGTAGLHDGLLVPMRTRDRGERVISWYVTRVGSGSRDRAGLLAFGGDVTERVEAQEELRASHERLRRIATYSDDVLWALDLRDPSGSYVSPASETLHGISIELLRQGPAALLPHVHEDDRPALRAAILATETSSAAGDVTFRFTQPGSAQRWIRARFKAVIGAAGERTHLVGSATDVTSSMENERAQLERLGSLERRCAAHTRELESTQRRLREIVDRLPGLVVVCTPDGSIVEASRTARRCAGRYLSDMVADGSDGAIAAMLDALESASLGEAVRQRATVRLGDPGDAAVELAYEPIRDRAGSVSHILVVASELARARSSAPPRTPAEPPHPSGTIHERAKDDLQVISSLLYLEGRRATDPRVVAMLASNRNRVRVFAMAHEHADPDAPERIDLGAYLHAIVVTLRLDHGHGAGRVRIEEELPRRVVARETAVPCGLIVNELVTNTLEHAFPEQRGGTIRVSIAHDARHALRVCVEDDGVGFGRGERGLGLELCERLAAELGGTIAIGKGPRGRGTSVTLRVRS